MDSIGFDTLLKGGRVICPATGVDGIRDVAIRNGRIAAVAETILPSSAATVIDVSGKLVLPGMIDTHGHIYQYVTGRFGLEPDMVGVRSGVTTVVDQGGPSCMTLPGFPEVHRGAVADPNLRLSLGLSGRRPRRPFLPEPLQPGVRRHRRDGALGGSPIRT